MQDAAVTAELLNVPGRVGEQLSRVATVGAVRRELADDLDLQPERLVQLYRPRWIEKRRLPPRRMQWLPVRRDHEVASLAVGLAAWPNRLRIHLLLVNAVPNYFNAVDRFDRHANFT